MEFLIVGRLHDFFYDSSLWIWTSFMWIWIQYCQNHIVKHFISEKRFIIFFPSITLLIFPSESMMQIKEKMENHILLLLSTMFLVMSILKTGFLVFEKWIDWKHISSLLPERKFAALLSKQSLFECVLVLIIILIWT